MRKLVYPAPASHFTQLTELEWEEINGMCKYHSLYGTMLHHLYIDTPVLQRNQQDMFIFLN